MTKKKDLSPELLAECVAAKNLFMRKKNALGLTQAKIAEAADISPAGVAMYLNGTNPLNLKFAVVFSTLLQEPIENFSPRLAASISQLKLAGTQAPLTQGKSTSAHLLQILNEYDGKLTDDPELEIIARALMDRVRNESSIDAEGIERDFLRKGEILIPQYDIRAAMGHGQVPPEYSELIRNIIVREEFMRHKGISYTSAKSLAIITGWGQSMEGTINDKDPVIVDRGITEYQGEGVYVLTWHGDLLIKRLQRKDENHLWLISDNSHYDKQQAHLKDVIVHARVLLVWNAKKI